MSRPALIEKLLQAGKWLLKPDLIPVDGTTLRRGGTDISVAAEALARSGGGLAVDARTGKLYVDFSLVPDDQMQAIVLAMVQQGGGLAVDRAGKLYVDFGSMPTEKFEAMLKSIRVPVWLTKNLNIYVNSQIGSNTLDEGRGLTPDKPFQTLGSALLYISTTYNLYTYDVFVNLAQGYENHSYIEFPSYQTTTGQVYITGPDQEHPEYVKIGRVYLPYNVKYKIKDLTIDPSNAQTFYHGVYVTQGSIDLQNVVVDISDTVVSAGSLYAICTEDSGKVRIYATNSENIKSGCKIVIGGAMNGTSIVLLAATVGSNIQFSADITIEGDGTVASMVTASSGASVSRTLSSFVNPGRLPIVVATGTISGRRYDVSSNGIINSNGGGTDFFPGTVEGRSRTGGQYV